MVLSSSSTPKAKLFQRQKTLSESKSDNHPHLNETHTGDPELDNHKLTNAELIHLRIRVIALENLIVTLLADGSDQQLELAREMASYISPREGITQHPLTIQAAEQMVDIINRAEHFRTLQSS